MSAKYNFNLRSQDKRRDLPGKIGIGRNTTETAAHVVLKLLAFLLFYRERLQIEANLRMDSISIATCSMSSGRNGLSLSSAMENAVSHNYRNASFQALESDV